MRGSNRLLLTLVCVMLAASCGEDGDPAGPGGDGPVTLEPGGAVTKTLASDGGSLTATSTSGVTYVLEVPPGALMAPTAITMTPVASIADLGLSGGLAGAVLLEPAGLAFARAAVLTIRTSETAGAGEQLAGFTGSADLTAHALSPAAAGNGDIAVLVPHFSVAGAGFGTTEDVSLFPVLGSNTLENLVNQLVAIAAPWDDTRRAQAERIGRDAFQQVVLPALRNAGTDAELVDAVGAYDRWRFMLDIIDLDGEPPIEALGGGIEHRTPAAFAADIAAAGTEAAGALGAAIAANNGVCSDEASLTALANVFFWQSQTALFGITDPALSLESVLAGICAEVRLAAVNLPAQMQVGFPHSLDADFVVHFGNGEDVPADFFVELAGNNLVAIQNESGFTGDAESGIGHYTTVVTATGSGEIAISARACLVLPGNTTPSPLCSAFSLTSAAGGSSGLDLTGDYIGASGVGPFGEPFTTVQVTQNQNAVTGTFQSRDGGSFHAGRFTATLSGTDLLNVEVELDGCEVPDAQSANGLVTLDGDKIRLGIPVNGTDCHGHRLNSIQVCGPHSSLNEIDMSGTYTGVFAIDIENGSFPVTATITGGFGAINGTFTGGRNGTISATATPSPLSSGCIFAILSDIQITFTDCPLTPGSPMDNGCVIFRGGQVTLALSTDSHWRDGCTGRDLTGFGLSKQTDLCTGN